MPGKAKGDSVVKKSVQQLYEERVKRHAQDLKWALSNLVCELEKWDVPQQDEEGKFGPETALGRAQILLDKLR